MNKKLKDMIQQLHDHERKITDKALKGGTYEAMLIGAFNLAQFSTQMLIKLTELMCQANKQNITVKPSEDKSETIH